MTRNIGATWVVASENEWYKAAYYDPTKNSGAGGYWLHATQSDNLGQNNPFTDTNGANYTLIGDHFLIYANGGTSGPGTTDVGTYLNADSFYGTFDQDGNAIEWSETIFSSTNRVIRSSDWAELEILQRSTWRDSFNANNEGFSLGFRVVSLAPVAIPESGTYAAFTGGVALVFGMMRRRKARSIG